MVTVAAVSPIALRFGTGGVIAGSIAAGIQTGIGNVTAGSLFASLKSLGITGNFYFNSYSWIYCWNRRISYLSWIK